MAKSVTAGVLIAFVQPVDAEDAIASTLPAIKAGVGDASQDRAQSSPKNRDQSTAISNKERIKDLREQARLHVIEIKSNRSMRRRELKEAFEEARSRAREQARKIAEELNHGTER